jgi:uncharacterized protein (TIGR03435 family)
MLDLISTAYGLDPSNVQSGPPWLETDRFDIVAKAPPVAFLITWHTSELIIWRTGCESRAKMCVSCRFLQKF